MNIYFCFDTWYVVKHEDCIRYENTKYFFNAEKFNT